jgi:Ceramidase
MSWRFKLRRHLVFLRHFFWEAYKERILLSIVAIILFASLITILNNIFYDHVIWEKYYAETGIDRFFCEYTDMHKLIRQPFNTFTNIIYLVLAIYCFSKGMEDIKKKRAYNLITANRFYSFTLSGILLYTFLGSTLFHSSLIDFFSKMDFSAVYSITLFPAMYLTHRALLTLQGKPTNTRRYKGRLLMISIFTFIYIILAYFLNDPDLVTPIVAVIILLIISAGVYLERIHRNSTNKDYLITCIASISVAGILFGMDIHHVFCSGQMRVSPHSLWHIFNGLAIFFFYLYIRSEHYDERQDRLRIRLMHKAHKKVTSK